MNTAKSRLVLLSNKTVKGAVKRICESLVEMADSIPDQNLSQIAIDKLSAYTSDIAVKSFVSNESRLLTLVDMGIKKSAERILTESSVSKYPHLKGPIASIKSVSEKNPDYLVIESYLNVLRPLAWEPIVKTELEVLEARKNELAEDILVKSSIDTIKTSRNNFIYGALIEKLEAYVMDRTSGSRKMIIQELDRYKFDTNINKLANNLRLIENSYGGFNVLSNGTKCAVKPSVGFVEIKESADYILLDGSYYKKRGSKIVSIDESEVAKHAPSLLAINTIAKNNGISIQGDSVVMFMGRDTIKINENGTIDLNGTLLNREELKHKAAITSIIDPSYSRGLNNVLTVHENIDKLMEIDFSKSIVSNIYEGVRMNVMRGDNYVVNYVNPAMNENKTINFSTATQLKNFVWDTLSYDISESFTETLTKENREVVKLQNVSNNLFNKIVSIEKELSKIANAKISDEDVRESKMINDLEETLQEELDVLKRRYNKVLARLNEASMAVPLPSVGDKVNVRAKGTGTVLSVDGINRRFIVLLNGGETIQCTDKDLSVVDPMIKISKTSSPEADLEMIHGSNAKPSGKHVKSGKMMKESLTEDVDSYDDIETISIDDVRGMTTNPSSVVRHPEFGSTYEEDLSDFNEMSSRGREDYDPEIDEDMEEDDIEGMEEVDEVEDHDDMETEADEMEEAREGYDLDESDDDDEEYDEEEDLDESDDDDEEYDEEEDLDESDDDDEDYDDDEDLDESDDDDEDYDDDEDLDEDIESDEIEMERQSEDDLHNYERQSRMHPGYGSQQVVIRDVDDNDTDDLEIQFEENEEDEETLGSYGGAIQED